MRSQHQVKFQRGTITSRNLKCSRKSISLRWQLGILCRPSVQICLTYFSIPVSQHVPAKDTFHFSLSQFSVLNNHPRQRLSGSLNHALKFTCQTTICTNSVFLSSKLPQNRPLSYEHSMVFQPKVQILLKSSPKHMVRSVTTIFYW